MTGWALVYGMAIPMLCALATLAVILLPAGNHLSWERFAVGASAYIAVQIGGAIIGGLWIRRAAKRTIG